MRGTAHSLFINKLFITGVAFNAILVYVVNEI